MAFRKTKSSLAQIRKKTSNRLKINGSKKDPADQLMTRVVNTFFDLNYKLHHAVILDNDDLAALDAKDQINKSIDIFAFMMAKNPLKESIIYQESVDKLRLINQNIFQQTKIIVQKHGRNHHSGLDRSKISNMNKNAIMFIVTVKSDFSKVIMSEITRENLLGACRMEDGQITTQEEKNDVLNALTYHFNGMPFITNGRIATMKDIHYAAFFYITASPLVRKWVEEKEFPFGITLELDLEQHTTNILCSSIDDWMEINRLFLL